MHELRALLGCVWKASQLLRLDKGSEIRLLWASKEWGRMRSPIGQHEQKIVAEVKILNPERWAAPEERQDVLGQVLPEQV